MGNCCSSGDVSIGGDKKKTPTGSSNTPFEDFSSISTRSKKSGGEKLETVTEEKEPHISPRHLHGPLDGRKSPHSPKIRGAKSREGLLTSSTTARNEYQNAHLSLNHTGNAALLLSEEQRDMDKVLLTIPFFDSLDTKHVKILRSFFTRRVYAPKEVVLAEGLPLGQQVFHIIINGRVEMCAKDAYGKRTVLQQFGPGEWFGEMTWNANQDQIQPVTVYALQKTTILYTSSYQFAAALQQFPQLSVAINIMNPDGDRDTLTLPREEEFDHDTDAGYPSFRKTENDAGPRSLGIGAPIQIQLKNIPFFAEIEELKLQQLAMLCEIRKKKAGTWICRQGADADGFYYIIKGRVEVSAHGFMDVEYLMSSPGGDIANKAAAPNRANGTSSPIKHRGSGNSQGQYQQYQRPDDSPGGARSRRGTTGGLYAPGTPLTAGITPSPPSTPNQRPQTRKSLPSPHGPQGHSKKRGSFSVSFKESEHAKIQANGNGNGLYDEKENDPISENHPPPGQNAYLDTLKSGDWFGEIALLEKTTRTASVQATQDCILLYLSRERFIRFLKFAPSIRSSTIFADLIRKRTANSLKCLPIFAPLKIKTVGPYHQFDEKRLALLGGMFHYLSVPANTNIFNEGDYGMAFYIVIQGTCVVTARNTGDEEVFLNELHDNDYFGEASLIHKVRCNATVKTKTNCLLLKLNGENFQKFLQVAPEVENLFRQRVNMRTSERLKTIPFFRNVRENKPWSKLDLLGALFTFEEFSMNELVFNQGTIGTKFYIIVSGEIEISVAKEKDSGESGSRTVLEILTHNNPHSVNATHHSGSNGGWFGEISLLRKTARTATARCVSANGAVLLSIDSLKFQKFLTIAPELSEDFTSLLIHRTSNLLKSFDLFKQVLENKPWSKMEMIASLFEYELVEQGQAIYSLGDHADKFYVIASGTVRLESRWAGMQTMHSQASFGAMELMKNIQHEKLFKSAKTKLEKLEKERKEKAIADGIDPATLPELTQPTPPVEVLRTHSAKAVELCGLMTMSIASFKSLLTLAPEIIPYFSAIAEHEHRRASEIGLGALNPALQSVREHQASRSGHRTGPPSSNIPSQLSKHSQASQASQNGAAGAGGETNQPQNTSHPHDSELLAPSTEGKKDSVSVLVLPPVSPSAKSHAHPGLGAIGDLVREHSADDGASPPSASPRSESPLTFDRNGSASTVEDGRSGGGDGSSGADSEEPITSYGTTPDLEPRLGAQMSLDSASSRPLMMNGVHISLMHQASLSHTTVSSVPTPQPTATANVDVDGMMSMLLNSNHHSQPPLPPRAPSAQAPHTNEEGTQPNPEEEDDYLDPVDVPIEYNPYPNTDSPIGADHGLSDSPTEEVNPDEIQLEAAATRLHDLLARVPKEASAQDLTDLGSTKPPPSPRLHARHSSSDFQRVPDLPLASAGRRSSHPQLLFGTITSSTGNNGAGPRRPSVPSATIAAAAPNEPIVPAPFTSSVRRPSISSPSPQPLSSILAAVMSAPLPVSSHPSTPIDPVLVAMSASSSMNGVTNSSGSTTSSEPQQPPTTTGNDEENSKARLLASSITITAPTPPTLTPISGPIPTTVEPEPIPTTRNGINKDSLVIHSTSTSLPPTPVAALSTTDSQYSFQSSGQLSSSVSLPSSPTSRSTFGALPPSGILSSSFSANDINSGAPKPTRKRIIVHLQPQSTNNSAPN